MITDYIVTLWFPFEGKPGHLNGVSTWPNKMGFYAIVCPKGFDRKMNTINGVITI